MIKIYCVHHHENPVCQHCTELLEYAHKRLETCPFKSNKPACNHCQVHCYSESKRLKIQKVMRFSGPRMILSHPLLSLGHLFDTFRKVPTIKDL